MYEIVKTVKGYNIERMIGTRRQFFINIRPNVFVWFHTIKAATAYIEANL